MAANQVARVALSGSTQGKGIKVVATATLGTTIHTTGISATIFDEIWLYAFNSDTLDRALTIEFGDATAPDHNIVVTVPTKGGLILVVPGLMLTGTGAAGNVVTAFAAAANVITLTGYINRVTP